ncbi:hypothetical protein RMCBS344292_01053 [Rhizopus microsporus]|nr:hypothetical protein RMCBS344292_01053 [Rhizopus microsporus]
MDYFSKFKKRITPPKVQATSAMQLAKFHKCWDYVHNIFISEDRKTNLHVKQTEIPERLREMVDMLVDEEARQEDENTTGVCMEYLLKNGILQYLVNVSEKMDYPEGIRGESIRMIANMVDLLDDRFLVHNAVHKPTIKLIRFCTFNPQSEQRYHKDLVDLMYIICSRIHGFPALLNVFFHDKQYLTLHQHENKPDYEFLLFTYLLRFVHREGRSGDFARTGLLFLIEMATDDHQLSEFILESDFATIIAAGLGALYSQLPRKLIVQNDENDAPLLGAYTPQDNNNNNINYDDVELGIEYSNSELFKYQLDSFLKLLEFCQDVLIRCPNDAISQRMLQFVRTTFLENILYPSILECSDFDGSSVAVISYIDLMLQAIQEPRLVDVILGFLMQQENDDSVVPDSSPYNSADRFTLKDLIFTRLQSTSQPTVIATLKLLKTLIVRHCRFANRLLTLDRIQEPPACIISHHIREIELYFALISAMDKEHANSILTVGYEDYLRDVEGRMDADDCYQSYHQQPVYVPSTTKSEKRRSFKYGQQRMIPMSGDHYYQSYYQQQQLQHQQPSIRHRLRSSDTLLQILLNLFSHFFAQSTELNLALTGVLSALAMCPHRSLEGWLTFTEHDRTHPDDILLLSRYGESDDEEEEECVNNNIKIRMQDIYAATIPTDDDEDDQSVDFGMEKNSIHMTAPTQFKSFPPFYTIFRTLTQQVDYYRSEIDDFNLLLYQRWQNVFATTTTSSSPSLSPSTSVSSKRRSSISSIMDNLKPASVSTAASIATHRSAPAVMDDSKTNQVRIQPLFPSNFSSEVSLSMLLNNIIILQETIKELVAIVQVRRSLGIDKIKYA